MFWSALRVFVALGLVLGVLFLMVRALQRRQGITKHLFADPWIRILTSRSIAPQKYVSLVEIGGDIFVLAISEAQITMLGKVENKAFAEQLLARTEEKPEGGFRFPSLPIRPKMRWPGLLRLGHGK